MDWSSAEAQVTKLAKGKPGGGASTVISVKSTSAPNVSAGVKRKVDGDGDGADKKKTRRGGSSSKKANGKR